MTGKGIKTRAPRKRMPIQRLSLLRRGKDSFRWLYRISEAVLAHFHTSSLIVHRPNTGPIGKFSTCVIFDVYKPKSTHFQRKLSQMTMSILHIYKEMIIVFYLHRFDPLKDFKVLIKDSSSNFSKQMS